MRTLATKQKSIHQYNGFGNQLWDLAGARPNLDLQFADRKDLNDAITGSNLIEFSRASSGTYYDSDGLIKKAITNYIEDSEGFNASSFWGKGALRGTITDNATTAPDESTTATLLVEDTQTSGRYINNSHSFVANTTYTVSCWAKKYSNTGTQDRYFGFVFTTAAFGVNQIVAFNLTGDGSFVISNGTGTASIEAYPDGWYRCSLTATATVTTNAGTQFRLSSNPNNGAQGYAGDGVSGLYIWGAQLEESSTLGEYVKTTGAVNSTPRFDHDPVTHKCLGLLIEEPRTNLIRYSAADMDNGWINGSSKNPTNLSLNMLGVFNGVRVTSNGQIWHNIRLGGSVPSLDNTKTYTVTDWWLESDQDPSGKFRSGIKVNGVAGNSFIQKPSDTSDPLDPASYNISNNTTTHGTISNIKVENAGSNVIKISYNFAPAVTGVYQHTIGPNTTTTDENIIVLGSQIEEGEFSTSYMPTTGQQTDRAADIVTIETNNFSNWYNQTQGSIFINYLIQGIRDNIFIYDFSDGTSAEEIFLNYRLDFDRLAIRNNDSQNSIDITGASTKAKHALGVASENYSVARDGTLVGPFSISETPSVNQLRIGSRFNGAFKLNGTVERLTYWPSRLPDSTLKTITN